MSAIPEFFVESPQQLANESGKNFRPAEVEGEELDSDFESTLQQVASEQEESSPTDVEEGAVEVVEGDQVVEEQVDAAEDPDAEEVVDIDALLSLDGAEAEEAVLPSLEIGGTQTELVGEQESVTLPVNERLTVHIAADIADGSTSQSAQVSVDPAAQIAAALNPQVNESESATNLELAQLDASVVAAAGPVTDGVATPANGVANVESAENLGQNLQTNQDLDLQDESLELLESELDEISTEVDVVQESLEQTTDADVEVAEVNRLSTQSEFNFDTSRNQIDAIENFAVDESSNNRGEQITAVTEFADGEANVDVSSQDTQAQQILAYPVEATQDPFHAVPDDVRDLLARSVSRQTVAAVKESLANAKPPFVQRITVEIHPADLGKLNIQVEVVRDAVQATIVATENFSADLLSRHKSDLVNTLSEFGFGQANVDISHQNSQSNQQQNRNFQSGDVVALDQASPAEIQAATHVVQVGVNLVA